MMRLLSLLLVFWASTVQAQQLNTLRAEQGLPGLTHNETLDRAAQAHANDMADRGYFNHQSPEGAGPGDRATAAGYPWCLIAENIAKGQTSQTEVMQAWANSPPHRTNMLRPGIREYGLARAPGDIWVLVLGATTC